MPANKCLEIKCLEIARRTRSSSAAAAALASKLRLPDQAPRSTLALYTLGCSFSARPGTRLHIMAGFDDLQDR